MYKKVFIAVLLFILSGVASAAFLYLTEKETPQEPETADTRQPEEPEINEQEKKLACVASLPLDVRIGQKLMFAGYAGSLRDRAPVFAEGFIGGVLVMDEVHGSDIASFNETMPITASVAVDQEGGTVQRYKSWGLLPGAKDIAANGSTEQAYEQYLLDYKNLKKTGITTNFAPVVDVISRTPEPLPGRMYSTEPEVVAAYAAENIKAAQQTGITPVIKHFPGLGSASGNTDFTPATTDSLETLQSRDLVPYRSLAPLHPDVMIGNMTVPGLTNGQPAIWSKDAITLLRNLGYQDAVVYSDSLTAEAVPGNLQEATLKAWLAGIDVVVIVQPDTGNTNLAALITSIVSYISDATNKNKLDDTPLNESVLRIFERKQVDPCQLHDLT